MSKYYSVAASINVFEDGNYYYSNFREAKKAYLVFVDEIKNDGWEGIVTLSSFELPKIAKRKLILALLSGSEFMVNKKELLSFEG